MLFNSLDYFVFLLLAVAGFWALARHRVARLVFIVVASCLFYMAANPKYVVLILGGAVVDFLIARRLGATERERERRLLLALSLTFNLGMLAVFKYWDFLNGNLTELLGAIGLPYHMPKLKEWTFFGLLPAGMVLPIGLSFHTFQSLSYVIEVYRDGHLDGLTVNVEMKPEHQYATAAEKDFAAKDLQHHIKSYIGVSAKIEVVEVGGIERSIGKAKRVIDKRPK